jgi:hypothetical protein
MRVFNLTDIPTAKLKQHKMVKQTIAIGGQSIEPGSFKDFDEADPVGLKHPLDIGAVAVGMPSQDYLNDKLKEKNAPKPAVSTIASSTEAEAVSALPLSRRSRGA